MKTKIVVVGGLATLVGFALWRRLDAMMGALAKATAEVARSERAATQAQAEADKLGEQLKLARGVAELAAAERDHQAGRAIILAWAEHDHAKLAQANGDLAASIERERVLRAQLDVVATDTEGVWRWQGDGEDDPESLSCPVVMSAGTLREIFARTEKAEAEAARERQMRLDADSAAGRVRPVIPEELAALRGSAPEELHPLPWRAVGHSIGAATGTHVARCVNAMPHLIANLDSITAERDVLRARAEMADRRDAAEPAASCEATRASGISEAEYESFARMLGVDQ